MTRTPLRPPKFIAPAGNLPVLLSVPHSGTDYPDWLLHEARRGRGSLETLEDPLVDQLVSRALSFGCGAIIARAPRAAVDCNRSPQEIDPATLAVVPGVDPGPRARGGLGIVPTRTQRDGDLWRRRLSRQDMDRRVAEAWRPYHQQLASSLANLQRRHAEVLLLDCHSMPARSAHDAGIVIGDRHGKSAARWLGDLARRTLESAGFSVAFNDPYAGGWIVDSLGDPARGVHALQLELDRSLYLDDRQRKPGAGFDKMSCVLADLARTLGDALLDWNALPDAAE